MTTQSTTPTAVPRTEKSTTWTPYTCPHCGAEVQVPEAGRGEMVTCPRAGCGRQFLAQQPHPVRASPESHLILPEGVDRTEAEQSVAPPVATPTTAQPVATAVPAEFRVGLASFRRYPLRWLGYGLLILAGLTALVFAVIYQSVVLTLLGLAGIGFAAYKVVPWWMRTRNAALVLTPERCVLESGTLTTQKTEVNLEDVTDVRVDQGWLPWLFGVGDIVIVANQGDEPTQLVLLGIENPNDVAARILRRPGHES